MSSVNIPEISHVCHTAGLASKHNCIPEKGYTALNVYSISLQQLETDCISQVGEKTGWEKRKSFLGFFTFLVSLQVLKTLLSFL